jgi:molybdenum cofactor synthesis domain-containing protein
LDGPIRIGILTISDRCFRGEQEDMSGPAITSALGSDQFVLALQGLVPDDKKLIRDTLKRWCDEYDCDVVFTTGGTGFSPRDVTPEATRAAIDREAPQISQVVLMHGLTQTPFAALSRGIAGIRGSTLVVNLAGSPTAASQGAASLKAILPHAVKIIHDEAPDHPV